MSITFTPAKMFIGLVGRHKGELIVAAAKAAGARGGTIGLGRTESNNSVLRALSLADVQQDIVFGLMGPEKDAVVEAVVRAAAANPKKLSGYAILLDVSSMMTRHPQSAPQASEEPTGRETMESGFELITVITNTGYGDTVMAEARKAGATGGTILNARGTGTKEDVKFFSIALVPEKDMLLIVAAKEKTAGIIKAVTSIPKLNEPGGGVVYTMNVEEFIVLGK